MKNTQIRLATISDAKQIAEVHVRSWQETYIGQVPQSFLDGLSIEKREKSWQENLSNQGLVILVVESDQRLLGFSCFGVSRDENTSDKVGEIGSIYLLEEIKGQGVGKKLWTQSLDNLKQREFTEVIVWVLASNQKARKFYEKMGLSLDGKKKIVEIESQKCEELRYCARL